MRCRTAKNQAPAVSGVTIYLRFADKPLEQNMDFKTQLKKEEQMAEIAQLRKFAGGK